MMRLTIRSWTGTEWDAILLGWSGVNMRVALAGWDDAVELRFLGGQWLSENDEPVEVVWTQSAPADDPVPLPFLARDWRFGSLASSHVN